MRKTVLIGLVSSVLILSGCVLPPQSPNQYSQQQQIMYGVITDLDPVAINVGNTSGAGLVVGGVLGGLVGNQFGKGSGRAAMTALGAIGGAVVGNQVENNRNAQVVEGARMQIHLDDGRSMTVVQPGYFRSGTRVRLIYKQGQWLIG